MLKSCVCDYSDAYIAVKGKITVEGDKAIFEKNAPFRLCISKFINTFIDNAEDSDIVMSNFNLLEYSDNYSMASGSLRNYYRDEHCVKCSNFT